MLLNYGLTMVYGRYNYDLTRQLPSGKLTYKVVPPR